jgi:hypothetical protein
MDYGKQLTEKVKNWVRFRVSIRNRIRIIFEF